MEQRQTLVWSRVRRWYGAGSDPVPDLVKSGTWPSAPWLGETGELDLLRADPGGEVVDGGADGGPRVGRGAGLGVDGVHAQLARPLVVHRIEAADQPVAVEDREHVVAVLPLCRRDVDLDPVVEPPHRL